MKTGDIIHIKVKVKIEKLWLRNYDWEIMIEKLWLRNYDWEIMIEKLKAAEGVVLIELEVHW
jgi:hypothetical protein